MNIHKYLIDKFFASDMAKPAKTEGKRAVKFQTVQPRFAVAPRSRTGEPEWEFINNSDRVLYITVQADFTKAGKK